MKSNMIHREELLQRNLSLGYSKLPEHPENRILFDFNAVKTKHLKEDQQFIDL